MSSSDLAGAEDGMDAARDGLGDAPRRRHRGAPPGDHDHQHGTSAPVDARRAPAPARARRRDGGDLQAGDRVPPHRASRRTPSTAPGCRASPYVTRADYLSPFFNELGYCLAVERLLGIEAPPRAQVLRVLVCELNRISSPPGLAGHRRSRARRRLGHAVRLPRARDDPRHLRGDHRSPDEPRVHPDRRRRDGSARRRPATDPRAPRGAPETVRRVRDPPERQPDLARAERRGRASSRPSRRSRSA